MPHRIRAAAIVLGALAAAAAAAVPSARAQTGGGPGSGGSGAAAGGFGSLGATDPSSALVRPGSIRPPPFPDGNRTSPPAPPPSARPAPGAAKPSLGGILTEQQARERVTAAGYTNLRTLRPTYSGSWTGQASMRGAPVRVTVDARGNVSADHSERYR